MFKLRLGGPGMDPPMFCLAWAGPGPIGVPFTLVPFEEVRPPRPPRRTAAAAAGAPSLGVKARRPEGETGAPATPPKPAKGSDQAGTRPRWR